MKTLMIMLLMVIPLSVSTHGNTSDLDEQIHLFILNQQAQEVIHSARMNMVEEYKEFATALAYAESSNNYYAVSPSGSYYGKYQFGNAALQDIGLSQYQLLDSYEMQETAMLLYLRQNYKYLSSVIEEFKGREINGITITESGILAAAHLVGHGGIRAYLYSEGRTNVVDGNGVSASRYLSEFGGYHLNLFKQKADQQWLAYLVEGTRTYRA